ncbi:MAG: hypothetical protein II262_05705, partial [Alistipes sp.]|nr:hypothetical protein [Alistipes sp.]
VATVNNGVITAVGELDLPQLRHLPGGPGPGLSADGLSGCRDLGGHRGQKAASPVGVYLAQNMEYLADIFGSFEIYFQNNEKNVCIFGKMGYNK